MLVDNLLSANASLFVRSLLRYVSNWYASLTPNNVSQYYL